ncbi:phage portal protein [Heyndrickxia oleronia]|uniref:Phage portal protein n=1 Tax=Heyndrickxia oleronia TaxID=38875 RepID=A0AAW6SNS5_9BACI|nr:phage portal protein [Heyndrickxia oleronia]MDH5159830.1 phage portal protein [Heyndrickxia oleronia]
MALFEKGKQFPPDGHVERLAKDEHMRKLFEGRQIEVYERATQILKDSPQAPQLKKLYIAVNLADILVTKPADLLVGDSPTYESGKPDDSPEQKAINQYVEENDLNVLIHENCIGNGYRGDGWIKVRYGYRQDFTEVKNVLSNEAYEEFIANYKMEPIIEHVQATAVFPEIAQGNVKQFRAINIATVEWVDNGNVEVPFLNVERHVPGFIIYKKFKLYQKDVVKVDDVPIQFFEIGDEVATGRDENLVETGLLHMPVFHIPYKSVDYDWQGIGGLEKIESVFAAINDRLVQIDYILWKHSDPTAYGPEIEGDGNSTAFGGRYIPVTKDDVPPGYMTWQAQLDSAFKELDVLISTAFVMSETPQWLFGTTMAGDQKGGTGTSHTDSTAIKARFMPILSKVKRIRKQYDKAIRDALWTCMIFDKEFGDYDGEIIYPSITWRDGIPRNEKEEAETMALRTGNKPTIDVHSAVKRMDGVDDEKAQETLDRIDDDTQRTEGFVNGSIFNDIESDS